MKEILAQVRNLTNFAQAFEDAQIAAVGTPRMVLVHGYTGFGKSKSIAWLRTRIRGRGIFVQATSCWSLSSMLRTILHELETDAKGQNQKNLDLIVQGMVEQQKPLFIDEADYLFRSSNMLDAARDIHDLTGLPVVLVGMEGIERKLKNNPQLSRRVTKRTKFQKMDLSDIQTLTDTVCEVKVEADLCAHILDKCEGSIAIASNFMLPKIEKFAKRKSLSAIDLEAWQSSGQKLTADGGMD